MLDVASVARSAKSTIDGPSFTFGSQFKQPSDPRYCVPIDLFQEGFNSMFASVSDIVNVFVHETATEREQPVWLDENRKLPEGCVFLVNRMLGSFGEHGSVRRSKIFAAFNQTQARLDHFLRSLVGKALTAWCLEWELDEEEYYRKRVDGNVKRVFESGRCNEHSIEREPDTDYPDSAAFEPALLTEMRWRLWQQHLTRTIQPTIQGKAWVMAAQLEAFMTLFIPPGRERKTAILDRQVDRALDGPDPWKPTSPRTQLVFDIAPERAKVRKELAELFTIALTWRIQEALCTNEVVSYHWIEFLNTYRRDENSHEKGRFKGDKDEKFDDPDAEAVNAEDPKVLLMLRPVVTRRLQSSMNAHDWTPPHKVCDGHVIRLRVRTVDRDGDEPS